MGQVEDCIGPGEDHDDQESQTLPEQSFLPINYLFRWRCLNARWLRVHRFQIQSILPER
jgi:hypothetical protein